MVYGPGPAFVVPVKGVRVGDRNHAPPGSCDLSARVLGGVMVLLVMSSGVVSGVMWGGVRSLLGRCPAGIVCRWRQGGFPADVGGGI